MRNPEQPQQPERSEIVKMAFHTLEERMKGRDLVFKDDKGTRRYYAISSPAGTINLHDCSSGYDHTLWADGTVETGDTSDVEGAHVRNIRDQELESMINEMEGLTFLRP